MSTTPLDLNISLATTPITLKLGYKVNNDLNNPTLTVYRGFTYLIRVSTTPEHPFRVKLNSGHLNNGSYDVGITNNGIFNGLITWKVADDTPNSLIYQSPSDLNMYGLITVKSPDNFLLNNMQVIAEPNLNEISLVELVEKFNHNARITLTVNDNLAGRGLRFGNNRQLEIDSYGDTRFFLDENNNVMFADSKIRVDDSITNVAGYNNPSTLKETINALASTLRQLKDPNRSFTSAPAYTLKELTDLITEATQLATDLQADQINLEIRYKELLEDYKTLLDLYKDHKHDASDIKTGIINPARLGTGNANSTTYLRGDSSWSLVD